jgi:hypothetical protein
MLVKCLMVSYCQFDEEQRLWDILDIIGDGSKVCTDIGARLAGSNVAKLIEERGYTGNLIDASEDACQILREKFPQANVGCVRATIDNINKLVPVNTHVLSIDVDSHDWWLWANLLARPAVVIMETTPCKGVRVSEYGAPRKCAQGYGASVDAMKMLGTMKGYTYLGRTKVNAFFTNRACDYRFDTLGHGGKDAGRENNVFA